MGSVSTSSRVLLGAALLLAVVAVHLWLNLRDANKIIANSTSSNQSQPQELQRATVIADNPIALDLVPDPVLGLAPEADAKPRLTAVQLNRTELMKDPEYRDARREQLRPQIMNRYPDLATELGLSPGAASDVFDILIDLEIFTRDSLPGSRAPDAPVVTVRDLQGARRQADLKMAELLGSANFQRWEHYRETLGSRLRMGQVQDVLESSGYPQLDATQQQALITAFHDAEKRRSEAVSRLSVPTNSSARSESQTQFRQELERLASEADREVLGAISPFLTTEQLSVLTKNLQQRLNSQVLGRTPVVQSRQSEE